MSAGPSALPPGSLIAGRYELVELIGQGGHGEVWKAQNRDTRHYVAVKLLNDVAGRDPQQIERLKREQQALVALAGTSAVRVHDLCRAPGGRMCLVMELLEGIDLEHHLDKLTERDERMAVGDLVAILDPIVATLERAHGAGILHRDLKPANVFLLASGGVRLLDFGLARLRRAAPLTAAGMILGSPSYIAPEVWTGSPTGLDHRVDVYSLGVIIFRALAGRLPFEGESLQQKFFGATRAERPSLHRLRRELPEEIDDWVQEVLAIEPSHRFNTVRGAWTALLAVLRAPELADRLVSPEDLASVGTQSPLGLGASPMRARSAPQHQESISDYVRAAADAVRRWTRELAPRVARGEKSVWLSPDELLDEEEAAKLPAPPRLDRKPAAFEPMRAPTQAAPPRAGGERSLVSEWLRGSQLRTGVASDNASDDVMEWFGVPAKDGTTTSPMKAIQATPGKKKTLRSFTPVPDDEDDLKAIFSVPDDDERKEK